MHSIDGVENLSRIFDSDELYVIHDQPDKQITTAVQRPSSPLPFLSSSSQTQSTEDMTFSSSPVLYPPASSPPAVIRKRKLFQTFHPREPLPKKTKTLGGFVLDDDSDSDDDPACVNSIAGVTGSNSAAQDHPTFARAPTSHEGTTDTEYSQIVDSTFASFRPSLQSRLTPKSIDMRTCSGQKFKIVNRVRAQQQSYEQTVAQRSVTAPGRAKKAYYGVDIHSIMDEAKIQIQLDEAAAEYRRQNEPAESVETPAPRINGVESKPHFHQMWTEKYRAKRFTDLVGDERTHRSVLRWLKSWDSVVFPGNSRIKSNKVHEDQEQQHRKILLLTGPPGLGKTTLAHVCAKQAGYEVLEINASDDRSRDVVRGRIKDALGTENVRGIREHGKARKAGRPVCVVVDEVDGVVTGSGGSGGEGGFMKALIDLVQLDQRNSSGHQVSNKGKKGDKFRFMRPLIMICNDVYAPSLRPLRQSSLAEIVHVRKPALEKVISRLKNVFERENIVCDNDAVRRLCESSWGLGTRKQNSHGSRGAGEGDIRSVLVQGEWMAHKVRATREGEARLTRKWVEEQIGNSRASQSGLGRGGVKEVVERVFVEGAGLPNLPTALSTEEARLVAESRTKPIGVADLRKRAAISALREMIDTTGDHDKLMTECFITYPTQVFQDDTVLSKPNASYEWLHFYDTLSSKVLSGQEWELYPYLSAGACGFHDLFAAVDRGPKGWGEEKTSIEDADQEDHPFSGPRADFAAYEAQKANHTTLTEMQSGFSAPLLRVFGTVGTIATELVPNVSRILAPEVKPVVVGGSGITGSVASVRKESEKNCVRNAVRVMHALGVEFEKVKIESEGFGAHANGGFALRMEPPIDSLSTFHLPKSTTNTTSGTSTSSGSNKLSSSLTTATAPVRYAVRQVLSQELFKEKALQATLARQARAAGLSTASLSTHPLASHSNDKENCDPSALDDNNRSPLHNVEQITAIATATASLSATPGSSTVLTATAATGNNGTALPTAPVKRDFFGRPIITPRPATPSSLPDAQPGLGEKGHMRRPSSATGHKDDQTKTPDLGSVGQRTWVSFHEGYSNAVRRHIGLRELMDGF